MFVISEAAAASAIQFRSIKYLFSFNANNLNVLYDNIILSHVTSIRVLYVCITTIVRPLQVVVSLQNIYVLRVSVKLKSTQRVVLLGRQ